MDPMLLCGEKFVTFKKSKLDARQSIINIYFYFFLRLESYRCNFWFNLSFRFIYQAVVRAGAGTLEDRDKKPILIIEAAYPPILVHPNQIGGVLAAGQVFNIGVRLKTSQVSCFSF